MTYWESYGNICEALLYLFFFFFGLWSTESELEMDLELECVKSENVLRVEPIKCHLSAQEYKVIDSLLIYGTHAIRQKGAKGVG